MLSSAESERYLRQITLPEIGETGQQRLKNAKVLCIGAGGIAASALTYLASMGVGHIGIMDGDTVERSNLARQTLFTESDIGKNKAEIACQRCSVINPNIQLQAINLFATAENIIPIMSQFDLVIEGSDHFGCKYLISDACAHLNLPLMSASVSQYQGMCAVFGGKKGPCYRCLYPDPPTQVVLNCAEAGVLGVVPGTLGSLQASETVKYLLGIGDCDAGRVLYFDALTGTLKTLKLQAAMDCVCCARHQDFWQLTRPTQHCGNEVQEISTQQLQTWLSDNTVQLLDVREVFERESFHIGGVHIPLGQLMERLVELDHKEVWVVYCHSGIRSYTALSQLKSAGFTSVYSLKGGLKAWQASSQILNNN